MQVSEFEKHVKSFRQSDVLSDRELLQNFALGLIGETGEVVDLIKKQIYHGETISQDKLKKEIGDALWYAIALCQLVGVESKLDEAWSKSPSIDFFDCELVGSCLALGARSGEIGRWVKLYSGQSLSASSFAGFELTIGEYLFTLLSIARHQQQSLSAIMQANVDKLVSRHGGNTFDRQAAIDYKAQHGSD